MSNDSGPGDQDGARGERASPRPAIPRSRETLIEQRIREAEAAGQFHNLPGAGKPLRLDDDDHVPEELRVAHRLLKNAGYAPPWIELQQRIREEQVELDRWRSRVTGRWAQTGELERARLRAEYEERLRDLNRQISLYNLIAPPAAGQLPLYRPDGL